MDALCETVMQICVLVSLYTLCAQLLPSERMRGMLHMACGWMLLHMMLSNLLALCGQSAPEQYAAQWGAWIASVHGR